MVRFALAGAAVVAVALAVVGLTDRVRGFAAARNMLDYPNHRSAHAAPTPRGGGIALVAVVLLSLGMAALLGAIPEKAAIALIGGGVLVAAVGWADDLGEVKARVRLAVHALAAAWAMAWLGWVTDIHAGGRVLHVGGFGIVLTVVAIVWAVNLYNFMDGLDGFAGAQGTTTGLVGAVLLLMVGEPGLALMAAFVAAACAGFLVWNWPPARIFMGDVGSGFLGYSLAILALASDRAQAVPVIAWIVVFGAFLFDATVTVVRRLLRGKRIFTAHREHAYQRATRKPRTHKQVVFALIAINALLAIMAMVAVVVPANQSIAVLVAVALLLGVYLAVEREGRGAAGA